MARVCIVCTGRLNAWQPGMPICCVTRRKQHRPGIAPNANTTHVPTAGSSAAPTKPNHSKPTLPRKRQTTPTNGHTPRRWKPTHTRLTYTRMRPHAPSHQAGDHLMHVWYDVHECLSEWLSGCLTSSSGSQCAYVWTCVTRRKLQHLAPPTKPNFRGHLQ